jgi:hypothetical protein
VSSHAKQSQFQSRAGARGQLCETDPICHRSTGRGGGEKRKSPRGRGQMRQTNPIGTGATSKASPVGTRNYGEFYIQRRLAKQTQSRRHRTRRDLRDAGRGGQSCKTKPIRHRRGRKTIAKARGLDAATRKETIVRNKANSHRAQTVANPLAGKELCRIRPLHRSRKTKPISATVPIGRSAFPGGPGARNKANSWDRVGRLTLPGPIGYNDMHADGFFFERGDAAESRGSKGWREPS